MSSGIFSSSFSMATGFIFLFLNALTCLAQPQTEELIQYLHAFHQNQKGAMLLRLPKRDLDGNTINHIESLFPPEDIKSGKFIDDRDQVRKRMCTMIDGFRFCLKDYLPGKAPFAANDHVEDLVELPHILRNLAEMESAGLTKARLTKLPWSDSYWPLGKGLVAIRYADPGFPNSMDWLANYSYITSHPAAAYFSGGDSGNLSPAEKYDFLVGDGNYTLTQANWAKGKVLFDTYHTVEGWDGICDGWAASSITTDEPVKSVLATAANGSKVLFYPSDIKGLSSLLWATGNNPTKFLGSRCTVRNPERDANGRTKKQECFDSNPGTFHMAIVNQLGQAKRPFIMDATYDYEIWNYPVWMYEYTYFNPQTLQPVNNWHDGLVRVEDFTIDKFKQYRSPNMKFAVGISMNVSYMVELMPSHYEGPHASPRTVHYIYDLELDENKTIIGGEWYTTLQHPDFIWTPPLGARAMSVADPRLMDHPTWTGNNPIPEEWTQVAPMASSQTQPLGVVIEQLVRMSKQ